MPLLGHSWSQTFSSSRAAGPNVGDRPLCPFVRAGPPGSLGPVPRGPTSAAREKLPLVRCGYAPRGGPGAAAGRRRAAKPQLARRRLGARARCCIALVGVFRGQRGPWGAAGGAACRSGRILCSRTRWGLWGLSPETPATRPNKGACPHCLVTTVTAARKNDPEGATPLLGHLTGQPRPPFGPCGERSETRTRRRRPQRPPCRAERARSERSERPRALGRVPRQPHPH